MVLDASLRCTSLTVLHEVLWLRFAGSPDRKRGSSEKGRREQGEGWDQDYGTVIDRVEHGVQPP